MSDTKQLLEYYQYYLWLFNYHNKCHNPKDCDYKVNCKCKEKYKNPNTIPNTFDETRLVLRKDNENFVYDFLTYELITNLYNENKKLNEKLDKIINLLSNL